MVIKDEQWEKIKSFMEQKFGRPRKIDDRMICEAILYIMRTGLQWRELPSEFPNWKTVYSRFIRWNRKGVWYEIWNICKKNWKSNMRNERYSAILQ